MFSYGFLHKCMSDSQEQKGMRCHGNPLGSTHRSLCVLCGCYTAREWKKNTVEDYDWSHPLVFVCRTGLWVAPWMNAHLCVWMVNVCVALSLSVSLCMCVCLCLCLCVRVCVCVSACENERRRSRLHALPTELHNLVCTGRKEICATIKNLFLGFSTE